MTTYYVKRGDVGSRTPRSFLEDGDGNPADLVGAAVRFIVGVLGQEPIVNAEAEVIDEETAEVGYTWADGDLDDPGVYRGEYEVTYSDTSVETFPVNGYIEVWILQDLSSTES